MPRLCCSSKNKSCIILSMSLTTYIENLRQKPEEVRKRASFMWAFSLTAIIFVFWVGSFSGMTNGINNSVSSVATKAYSPGQAMIAGVGDLAHDIWSMIIKPKKVVIGEVQVSPGTK